MLLLFTPSFSNFKISKMMGGSDHPLHQPQNEEEQHETLDLSPQNSTYQSTMSTSFIDPPSYSDATFSPTQTQESPKSDLSSSYVSISISDPRKEQDLSPTSLVPGSATHVTYLVTTTCRDLEVFKVRRRFRDFVILADRLAEGYRGYFVPVRPDKNSVESQIMDQKELVEQRKFQLEKYLWRLARHPVIGKSDELKVFLTVEGKMPLVASTDLASRMLDGAVKLPRQLMGEGAIVEKEEVVIPAKGGRDLLRIFKELKQSVSNEWGSGVKATGIEEDKEFLERKERVGDLEQQISTTSQQAEVLVKAQQDIEETMGQLGLAFIKLVKLENEEGVYSSQKTHADDARVIATAAVKTSRLYRELNFQTVKYLDTLHEYLGLMLSVRNAFTDRTNALLTVQTLVSDLSNLHSRAVKLEVASSKIFGGDESRIRKLEEIKKSIQVTEEAKSIAISQYERIKGNNKSELERIDVERHNDFLAMLKGFVTNQALYSEKVANVWSSVAEETRRYARDN